MRRLCWLAIVLPVGLVSACMEYGRPAGEHFILPSEGVFVLSEGNFMYGNASLDFYDPITQNVENELFACANGIKLGDVATDMTILDERGYIAVDNSGVVFVIDITTGKLVGLMRGLVSPRRITILSAHKGYITSLLGSLITVFDPATLQILGSIETYHTTEEMVVIGDRALVTCWSYDRKVLVINTLTDSVVDSLTTAVQPRWIVADGNGKVWILTDGGYAGSGFGYGNPTLQRIDPQTLAVELTFYFPVGDSPRGLAVSPDGQHIYFINRSLWRMRADADELPTEPLVTYSGTIYYALGVAPSGELYLADAIDYMQSGIVYRYGVDGTIIDSFRTGIIPTMFCFK